MKPIGPVLIERDGDIKKVLKEFVEKLKEKKFNVIDGLSHVCSVVDVRDIDNTLSNYLEETKRD